MDGVTYRLLDFTNPFASAASATRIALAKSVAAPVLMILSAFSRSCSVRRIDVVGVSLTVGASKRFADAACWVARFECVLRALRVVAGRCRAGYGCDRPHG